MKKILGTTILMFILVLTLTACGQQQEDPEAPESLSLASALVMDPQYPSGIGYDDTEAKQAMLANYPVSEEFRASVDSFAYDTTAAAIGGDGNRCFSPLSLYYALALATSGAEGETLNEFLSVLHVEDKATLIEQSGNLFQLLYIDNEYGKLRLANSLWLEGDAEKIQFNDAFMESAAHNLYASLFAVDYSNPQTAALMGEWVAQNTNDTLQPIFEVTAGQVMTIINTVYYKDEWLQQFPAEETTRDIFYPAEGFTQDADYMHKTDLSGPHYRGDNFTRASVSLKNSGKMIFILPDEGTSATSLLTTADSIKQLFEPEDDRRANIVWSIPKFSYNTEFDLVDQLKNVGLNGAFSETADFSAMADRELFISSVNQETHIAIDENGVEASACTDLAMVMGGLGEGETTVEMKLERPFIYGIEVGGVLAFIGVCTNPIPAQ